MDSRIWNDSKHIFLLLIRKVAFIVPFLLSESNPVGRNSRAAQVLSPLFLRSSVGQVSVRALRRADETGRWRSCHLAAVESFRRTDHKRRTAFASLCKVRASLSSTFLTIDLLQMTYTVFEGTSILGPISIRTG